MKKIISYSIDEKVLLDFKNCANKNSLNASKFIENKLKEYIKDCIEKEKVNNEL